MLNVILTPNKTCKTTLQCRASQFTNIIGQGVTDISVSANSERVSNRKDTLEERRLWLLGGYRASAVFAVFLQFYFLCRVNFALSCLLSTADSIAILVFRIFCGFPS